MWSEGSSGVATTKTPRAQRTTSAEASLTSSGEIYEDEIILILDEAEELVVIGPYGIRAAMVGLG